MAINNQPTIKPQTVTGAFLRYIAKTIPLAFDESMSYYECICALRDYINQFIDNLNNVNDGLSELQTFYLELQDYVNNYFDNLDVQEEINNKLDQMAADGSLTLLIKKYVDPIYQAYETSINQEIDSFESSINNSISSMNSTINSINDNIVNSIENLTSATPLVASSTAGMTNTSRIYVNSTDGHWYWYDGNNWQDGGVYQATEIANDSIINQKLRIAKKTNNLLNDSDINFWSADGSYDYLCWSDYIDIENETKLYYGLEYTENAILDPVSGYLQLASRFYFYDENKKEISSEETQFATNNLTQYVKNIPNTSKYVRLRFSTNNASVSLTPTKLVNGKYKMILTTSPFADGINTHPYKSYLYYPMYNLNIASKKIQDYNNINILSRRISSLEITPDSIRNGSIQNGSSTVIISCNSIVCNENSTFEVYTDRPLDPNCEYRWSFASLNDSNTLDALGLPTKIIDVVSVNTNQTNNIYTTKTGTKALQIALAEYNTTNEEYETFNTSTFGNYRIIVIEKINTDIERVINNKLEKYPLSWNSYMTARINTVREKDALIQENGDAFIFITDLHNENNYYSPYMAKDIIDKSSVNKLIYGGDYINEPSSKEQAIAYLTSRSARCRVIDSTIFIRGNHDSNPYGTGSVSIGEYYGIFDKHIEKDIDTNKKIYFYYDNIPQKIRYIYLDTNDDNIDNTQQTWLSEITSELTSEWTIVIFGHYGIHSSGKDDKENITPYNSLTIVRNLLQDINATIACYVCGHVHQDLIDTSGSFPVIAVTCDAHSYQATSFSSDDRTEGTINEQAFDVFHIDTNNKTIYVTRIGGGPVNVITGGDYTANDRTFTY